jgi:hypothetical protein
MGNAMANTARASASQPISATAAKPNCGGFGKCACEECSPVTSQSMAPPAHDFGRVAVYADAEERGGPPFGIDIPSLDQPETFPAAGEKPPGRFRGGALPYRQAQELADCIRILGEDAREECRQLVLGEKPPCDRALLQNPVSDLSTFQSPGASGWFGAKFGCFRSRCTRRHRGWDIHAPVGTSIFAVAAGNVTLGVDPDGYGDFIRLRPDTDPNRTYLYAHLSARHPAGHYCAKNTIGATGITGNASADRPHLHFEVQVNGVAVDPGSSFTEPANVIEATGSAAAAIDKTLPEPCNPCAI